MPLGYGQYGYGQLPYGQGYYGESNEGFANFARRSNTIGTLLVKITLNGRILYLSDKYITVGTIWHEGVIQDWGMLSITSKENLNEISDINLTLFNKRLSYMSSIGRISEMTAAYQFEGSTIEIRQFFEGLTTYDDCRLLFRGKINAISFDDMYFEINAIDDLDIFKEIPINRISKQEYAYAPDISIGLPKQIIYGKSNSKSDWNRRNWTLFPTVYVNRNTLQYLLADHLIGQDDPFSLSPYGNLFLYVSEIDNYLQIWSAPHHAHTNTAAGATVTLNQLSTWRLIIRPTQKGSQYNCTVTDPWYAIDEDHATGMGVNALEYFYMTIGSVPDLGTLIKSSMKLRIYIANVTGAAPYARVHYYNPQYDNAASPVPYSTGQNVVAADVATGYVEYTFGTDQSTHGEADDQSDRYTAWNWNEIGKYEFGLTVNAECALDIVDIYLDIKDISFDPNRIVDRSKYPLVTKRRPVGRSLGRSLKERKPVLKYQDSPVFFHAEGGGAEFGAWIDERSNGRNAGDVIECPAYVIEDILRRVLNVNSAQIDVASFDSAGNTTNGTLKDWKFFGALSKIENAQDVLNRLCMQCKSRLFRDENGLFSFWVYNTSAALTYTDYKFDQTNTISGLKIYRTSRNDVKNTIRINYMLDRGSEKYQKQTFVEIKKKFSGSYLAEAIDAIEYAWDVDDGTDFTADDYILVDSEICRVLSIATNTLTLYNAAGVRTVYANSASVVHDDNSTIYILTTNSDNGNGIRDQNAADPADREFEAIESVWRYGITSELVIDADFISDDSTAVLLRNHLFDYSRAPKYIVEFDTFLNASDVIANDIIEFDSAYMDIYLKLGNTSWNGLKFVVNSIERTGTMGYSLICEQLTYSFI